MLCRNATHHRIAQGRFYLHSCLSTVINDAPACRRVDRCHTMLIVGLGDLKPARLPSLPSRRNKKIVRPQPAKKDPTKIMPREFPPCSFEAPTAGPCTPYPRRPSPRCAHEYSAERIGTAPVAISALIRRRYGTPHAVRPRRPLGPREVAESCSVIWSTRGRRWGVRRNDPRAIVSGPWRGPL